MAIKLEQQARGISISEDKFEISTRQIHEYELERAAVNVLSLDKYLNKRSDNTLADLIPALDNFDNLHSEIKENLFTLAFESIRSTTGDVNRADSIEYAIRSKFGLNNEGVSLTVSQIAVNLGLSKSGVGLLLKEGIGHMRRYFSTHKIYSEFFDSF